MSAAASRTSGAIAEQVTGPGQEPGSSGKTVIHDLLATTVFAGYDFRARPSTGSKVLRAKPLAAATEAGNVTALHTVLRDGDGSG
ncbi:MAG: hypothetical protein ACR2K2_12230 [Mycobacteriales bacterium]